MRTRKFVSEIYWPLAKFWEIGKIPWLFHLELPANYKLNCPKRLKLFFAPMGKTEFSPDDCLKFLLRCFEVIEARGRSWLNFEILTSKLFSFSGRTALNLETVRQTNALSICTWFLKNQLSSINWIFCLVWTWILQATQAVKIQYELDQKSSLSNLIFQAWFWEHSHMMSDF